MTVVIQINDRQRRLVLDREGIAALARWVLEREGCREGELSLLFTNNSQIRKLNREYLGRDYPTDVLAFPQDGQSSADELALCLIHGILHLFGWGDHPETVRAEMRCREENLLESWKRRKRWSLIK